jgi:hypothetical protein
MEGWTWIATAVIMTASTASEVIALNSTQGWTSPWIVKVTTMTVKVNTKITTKASLLTAEGKVTRVGGEVEEDALQGMTSAERCAKPGENDGETTITRTVR